MNSFEIRMLLEQAWDAGNACGLDGFTGPGRGTLPVDDEAVLCRDRDIDSLLEIRPGGAAPEVRTIPLPWFFGDGVLTRRKPLSNLEEKVRITPEKFSPGEVRLYRVKHFELVGRQSMGTDVASCPTLTEAIRRAEEWIP